MIQARTSAQGVRTYTLPQVLADIAMELFPDVDQTAAVFRMAMGLTWADCHTTEQIALNGSRAEAVAFARERMVSRSTTR